MAAKHGNGSEDRDAGTAASGVPGAPIDGISERELIDSAGSRETVGTGFDLGNAIGGDESNGGDGGSESEIGGRSGGRSAERSGESEGTAAGTRKRTRTRNRSRSSGRSASAAASEETRHDRDDFSRPIEPPKRPKLEAEEIPSASAEIIGDCFAFAFWGIGQATGLPEWELPEDDSVVIGKNGEKWLKSLGKKRSQAIMKGLSKLGPSLAFFGSLGMALVPRVKLTIQSAKHGAIKPIQERKENRSGGGSSQSVAPVRPETVGDVSNIGSAGERSRPFTPKDFSEVTQGFAGSDDGLPVS